MGKTVAVFFGGPSNEHEISCLSAKTVISALIQAGYQVLPIAVDLDLTWRHTPDAAGQLASITNRLPTTSDLSGGAISTIEADVAFPVLHGAWGEDGGVQRELTKLEIPYVGSNAAASELAMDKAETKKRLTEVGVRVVQAIAVSRDDWQEHLSQIESLGANLFVKPRHGGSSLGVTHVKSDKEIPSALEKVFQLTDQALVEVAVQAPREIEIGVLQHPDQRLQISVCGEIKLKSGFDFYDYQAKYLADGAELIVPAKLNDLESSEFAAIAEKSFNTLGCAGLARVDFLLANDGSIYFNEVNTMPGFTSISMYPRMFAASGVSLPTLVSTLIEHGIKANR